LHLDPGSGSAYALLGESYAAKGANVEAIAACDTALGLTPDDSEHLSRCGAVYALSGKHRAAVDLFQQLQLRLSRGQYVDPYRLASLAAAIYTSPTESDRILQWLARAYEERSANLCTVKVNPAFRRVSADRRFQELLGRMDFPK
jgi:tetratricopeptide (TPR) repeat protein